MTRVGGSIERVFGHAELEVVDYGGRVGVRFKVTHGARFIELCMRGRRACDVPYIASRICGACSIAHCLAAVRALENALDVRVDEDVEALRDAVNAVQVAQNHVVHLAFLAMPDYGGVKGLKPSETVRRALRINSACLKALNILAGRIVNPTTLAIGGLSRRVSRDALLKAADTLLSAAGDAETLLASVAEAPLPRVREPPSYGVCLKPVGEYLTRGYEVVASSGALGRLEFGVRLYRNYIREFEVPYSNSKHVLVNGSPAFTGPRARLSAYGGRILERLGRAAELVEGADLSNPFTNIVAEAAEALYVLRYVPEVLKEVDLPPPKAADVAAEGGRAAGVAGVEAPRGILIHAYVLKGGRVEHADIVTPTEVNARHIEACGELLATDALGGGDGLEELERLEEALVRSYDPCLPCAVHVIRLRGV